MKKEQLAGTVAGLILCALSVIYAGSYLLRDRREPLPSAMVGPVSTPASLTARSLACVNVPKPFPQDISIILAADPSNPAYMPASLRFVCNNNS